MYPSRCGTRFANWSWVNSRSNELTDDELLKSEGYIECSGDFRTYVPAARGLLFPEVRLTVKGRDFQIPGIIDRGTQDFFEGFVFAYRARNMGNGVVAGRETLEEWLDEGDEAHLSAVVDPHTGGELEAWQHDLDIFF